MKKNIVLALLSTIAISTGLLMGCGQSTTEENGDSKTESQAEETAKEDSEDSEDSKEDGNENAEEKEETESDANVEENSDVSVNPENIPGIYYYQYTGEIEGYEVKETNWIALDDDKTGCMSAQDVIDISWDEETIDLGTEKVNYELNDNVLTLNYDDGTTEEFTRLEGNMIVPQLYEVDITNPSNGIYPARFLAEDMSESELKCSIYELETFDIVDVNTLAVGDGILVDGRMHIVENISNKNGRVYINGTFEEDGVELAALDESNCYVFSGMDDYHTYALLGEITLPISETAVFEDNSIPGETVVYEFSDIKAAVDADDYFFEDNTEITIEDGTIVEIVRNYVP